MYSIGIDLSKNHFGLCRINEDRSIDFLYLYFKPYLKRDRKTTNELWFKKLEEEIYRDKFSFKKIRISYDDEKQNIIECDCLKSRINLEEIKSFIDEKKGSKLIVLEDYVMSGSKVVQLVHVGESFKYQLAERLYDGSHVLFLCPVQTWRKFINQENDLKSKDAYVKINSSLKMFHKDVYDFIYKSNQSQDIIKEMIDSYCLANIKRHYNDVFMKQYHKRIFIF